MISDIQQIMMHKEIIARLDKIAELLEAIKESMGPVANMRAPFPPLAKSAADAIATKSIYPDGAK